MEQQRGRRLRINQDCPKYGFTVGTDDPSCGNLEKGATNRGGMEWPARGKERGHSTESPRPRCRQDTLVTHSPTDFSGEGNCYVTMTSPPSRNHWVSLGPEAGPLTSSNPAEGEHSPTPSRAGPVPSPLCPRTQEWVSLAKRHTGWCHPCPPPLGSSCRGRGAPVQSHSCFGAKGQVSLGAGACLALSGTYSSLWEGTAVTEESAGIKRELRAGWSGMVQRNSVPSHSWRLPQMEPHQSWAAYPSNHFLKRPGRAWGTYPHRQSHP